MNGQLYNPYFIFWSRIINILIWPFYSCFNLFRKSYSLNDKNIKSILICQYHRIGDVFLIASVLRSIKKRYPQAHVILLCCRGAEKLSQDLDLAHEIIGVEVPWTNWHWSLIKWIKARSFARNFRKRDIDIAIDFKGDLRNSWFLWHVRSKMSLGYTDTGGSFFYTHPQQPPMGVHQTERALRLISHLGIDSVMFNENKLYFKDQGAIVFHAGGSDPRRAWPENRWVKLAETLSITHQIAIVKTPETATFIERIKERELKLEIFDGDLVQFKNWLINQKMLIGNDSMPGHLAAYIGIPVISIFGSQDPNLTCPIGKWITIIQPHEPCEHERNHWRFCQKCMETIDVELVSGEVTKLLARVQASE
tara:strand:- start:540 stop:1631 length:1092 start_codon:yes stop_codon:yes gene_type:complete